MRPMRDRGDPNQTNYNGKPQMWGIVVVEVQTHKPGDSAGRQPERKRRDLCPPCVAELKIYLDEREVR
jgi:hypothetical protein